MTTEIYAPKESENHIDWQQRYFELLDKLADQANMQAEIARLRTQLIEKKNRAVMVRLRRNQSFGIV